MTDIIMPLTGLATGILGGGGVFSYLQWKSGERSSEIARLRQDVNSFRAELRKCEEKHDLVEDRLREVEHSGGEGSYMARWIKDVDKRVIWVNDKALLTIFAPLGIQRKNIYGKTFSEILDADAAAEIDMLDLSALAHPGAVQQLITRLDPHLPYMVVLKIAATSSKGELIYEGYAYQQPDPEIAAAFGATRQLRQIERSGGVEG